MANHCNDDRRPNILMIMVDQLSYPQKGYGSAGFADPIKDILSFVGDLENNPYAKHFPGFCKLREHAVVLTDHTIAEAACTPSRASIMTGQYGPRTGVTQTDGMFKNGDAQNFPWLKADGTPTIGDWFRELGYSTHYFGKWHVSDPPEHTLEGFGFGEWELSWPEPHGALINNLGSFRDYQFADLACTFLRERGLGVPYDRAVSTKADQDPDGGTPAAPAPFFAVCSFTNPHDIAAYPTLPRALGAYPQELFGPGKSVPIPEQGQQSIRPQNGYFRVPLNPTGLPQDCASASPSQDEDLLTNNKPRAQFDYSYKLGLGLASGVGLAAAQGVVQAAQKNLCGGPPPAAVLEAAKEVGVAATLQVAVPFQLQDEPDAAAVGFLQYYAYMISMVDRHILRVLDALDDSGLRENTIVAFVSDHGEYGAAHSMMMEKWHGAYQEAVNVPVLFSGVGLNPRDAPVALSAQTSHIDLLPTLLGLAGCDAERREHIRGRLSKTHPAAPLPGADLTSLLRAGCGKVIGPDGKERTGVLFVTDDMITEPLPKDDDPHNISNWQQFEIFCATVEQLRGEPGKHVKNPWVPVPDLTPGSVVQPCHVRALRSGPWKLVRYCDPWSAKPVPDEWELYNLDSDPTEQCNLVVYDKSEPTVIEADQLPSSLQMTRKEVQKTVRHLHRQLAEQEAMLLAPYPSAYPSAGASAGG